MIDVTLKDDANISGSCDQLWATADEARALAAELIRAADVADGGIR